MGPGLTSVPRSGSEPNSPALPLLAAVATQYRRGPERASNLPEDASLWGESGEVMEPALAEASCRLPSPPAGLPESPGDGGLAGSPVSPLPMRWRSSSHSPWGCH